MLRISKKIYEISYLTGGESSIYVVVSISLGCVHSCDDLLLVQYYAKNDKKAFLSKLFYAEQANYDNEISFLILQ